MSSPIFIFSLPRSGSTLLQRILSGSQDISTAPEPWILLPFFSYENNISCYANYSHNTYVTAMNELFSRCDERKDFYYSSVRSGVSEFYDKLSDGKRYFLDKTPRYYLIAPSIVKAFPDAKYIFLWRNPAAIMSSISRTWLDSKWKMSTFEVDLYDGVESLVKTFQLDNKNFHSLRYEDLVKDPNTEITNLERFLDLENGDLSTDIVQTKLFSKSALGDPTGLLEYSNKISQDSLDRWKDEFKNNYRKKSGMNYLDWIGDERLNIMGYDKSSLVSDIKNAPLKGGYINDYVDFFVDEVKCLLQSKVLKKSVSDRLNGVKGKRLD
ncbi:sulfotransferase family protein [Rubritalea spongiae]|uniref:Sulfotransferase family protein n=1 Tax=Rubritalea spongiae TaxID=430797 RepID=A0ABW5E1G2_9BACT